MVSEGRNGRPAFSLVVPAYNEEERLAESLPQLVDFVGSLPTGSELIVVDDGSQDGTARVARDHFRRHRVEFGHLLVRPHEGKGAAVQNGLQMAEAAFAGFCDADLSTGTDEISRLLHIAVLGTGLVIASRDVLSTRVLAPESRGREALGKAFNRLLRATVTPGIYDTQCGAKVAPRAIWYHVLPRCRERGYAWDVEVIAMARKMNFAVYEVGVVWRHDDRSRVRPLRDGAGMVWAVQRVWRNVAATESLVCLQDSEVIEPAAVPLDAPEPVMAGVGGR